jgi:hypothetical protein
MRKCLAGWYLARLTGVSNNREKEDRGERELIERDDGEKREITEREGKEGMNKRNLLERPASFKLL